jgi:hypothetical protein
MTNEQTNVAKTARFDIGLGGATMDTVRLFIKAMYDEWDNEMDSWGSMLLRLAHCYESDRVLHMAQMALKRSVSSI